MSDSDSKINKLIEILIQNFESKKVTGLCIEILRNALNEESIDGKIEKLLEIRSKLESETMSCDKGGEYFSTKINMKNNKKIKDKLILLIDNTINKIEKVQKAEAEAEADQKRLEEEQAKKAEEEAATKLQALVRGKAARAEAEEEAATKLQAIYRGKAARAEAEARRKAAQEKAEEEQANQAAENLKELLNKEEMSINDAMEYFDKDVQRENIAYEFISIEVKQEKIAEEEEAEGGKKPAKKPKRRANKTKRAKKSNKKKRKPKRKTMRKIKKIIFR